MFNILWTECQQLDILVLSINVVNAPGIDPSIEDAFKRVNCKTFIDKLVGMNVFFFYQGDGPSMNWWCKYEFMYTQRCGYVANGKTPLYTSDWLF